MIISFSVKNFLSIRDKVTFDFLATPEDLQDNWYFPKKNNLHISSVIGYLGANASGKTNVLRALYFVIWMMLGKNFGISNKHNEFMNYFIVNSWFSGSAPMDFEIVFGSTEKQRIYNYNLKLSKEDKGETYFTILEEILSYKPHDASKNKITLFSRVKDPNSLTPKINTISPSASQQGKIISHTVRDIKDLISNDTTLFSALSQFPRSAKQMPAFLNLRGNIKNSILTLSEESRNLFDTFVNKGQLGKRIEDNPTLLKELNNSFANIDIGISSIQPRRFKTKPDGEEHIIVTCTHPLGDKEEILPFFAESDGTHTFLEKYCLVRPVLKKGGIAIIDEIDSYMHPLLVAYFISLFRHPATNKGRGQLIFSSHSSAIFDVLGPSHIYLTEKIDQASSFYKATNIEGAREDIDLGKSWLMGELGAIPNIKGF